MYLRLHYSTPLAFKPDEVMRIISTGHYCTSITYGNESIEKISTQGQLLSLHSRTSLLNVKNYLRKGARQSILFQIVGAHVNICLKISLNRWLKLNPSHQWAQSTNRRNPRIKDNPSIEKTGKYPGHSILSLH